MANLIDIDKLMRASTFARQYTKADGTIGCSQPWVNKLEELGEIEVIRIDGVKFIRTK